MEHELIEGEALDVVGLVIRTNNEDAGQTIGAAWHRFMEAGFAEQVANRADTHTIVAVYTDYESDENGPYTFMLGVPVTGDAAIPAGLERRQFPAQRFARVVRRGPVPAVVQSTWTEVYASELQRSYVADIERYDVREMGPQTRLELHIGVR